LKAQVEIWQNGFCFGTQPCSPFGQAPLTIFGHISQAMPQTPTFMVIFDSNFEFKV
jgi:hypothetical protein